MKNSGHTLVAQFEDNAGFIEVGGEQYKLLQFHFHTASEHRVQGETYPMEIHLVHQNKQGKLLVVGVLVRQGQPHLALVELFKQLPEQVGDEGPSLSFNVRDLLPQKQGYFHYQGSLTTPPCTQDVQWYVMTEPVMADQLQIAKLLQSIGGKPNNRPVQPLNGRTVWRRLP
ncbi:MAG: carbonic anhydrase family protein [Myxococcota bacterium]